MLLKSPGAIGDGSTLMTEENGDSFVNSNNVVKPSDNIFSTNELTLRLYVSFPNRGESIALELLEAFHAYCERHNLNCFRLFVRLSQEGVNAERWDERFIRK